MKVTKALTLGWNATVLAVTLARAVRRSALPTHVVSGAKPLERAHRTDAGFDLSATTSGTLNPGERRLVPVGNHIALPPRTVGLVCPRSGLAVKHGVTVLNAPGVVDSGYRGELQVILANMGNEPFTWAAGDRVAQLVIVQHETPVPILTSTLPDSDRGAAGFGSTGVWG